MVSKRVAHESLPIMKQRDLEFLESETDAGGAPLPRDTIPSPLEYQFHGGRAGIRLLWGLPKSVHIRIRVIARTPPILLSESIRW